MIVESQLIPSLTEGLFLFDADCRLVRLNPSGERLLGRSEKSMTGRTAEEVFPANAELSVLIRSAVAEGRSVAQRDFELINAGGKRFFLSLSVSLLQDPDGSPQGAVVLARDETLLREIDRSFRRADQLTTLGTLNLGMAHEIKNPLGGIKGATQLLRLELGDDHPLAENCDVILREVERIDRLLESLLSAAPREHSTFEELNIHEVLDEVIELLGHWKYAEGITYTQDYDPSLPSLKGDRNGLIQIFLNLMKNAAEAMKGSGRITIRTLIPVAAPANPLGARRGSVLEVDIEDEGPGFERPIEDVTAPFFTTKPKGVGLGLAISEQIIQNHGGSLNLENREGSGVRARVFLPLNPPEDKSP